MCMWHVSCACAWTCMCMCMMCMGVVAGARGSAMEPHVHAHVHLCVSAHLRPPAPICIAALCMCISTLCMCIVRCACASWMCIVHRREHGLRCVALADEIAHASAQFAFLAAAEYDAHCDSPRASANAEGDVADDEGEGGDTISPLSRTARFSHGSSSGSLTCSRGSSHTRPAMHTTRSSMLNDDGEATITIGQLRRESRLSRTRSSLARSLSLWT